MLTRSSLRRSTDCDRSSVGSRQRDERNRQSTYKALIGELRRLGYVEGQILIVEGFSGEGQTADYAELASEVVRQMPDPILTNTNRMVRNFKAATTICNETCRGAET
jgi:hypothetical protein